MADFQQAIKILLQHEGGYVNNPSDPGGATKYGLSQSYLQNTPEFDLNHDGVVDASEIKNITINQAIQVYKSNWWDKYGYDRINSDKVASKLFDEAVNLGQKAAVKLIQAACNKMALNKRIPEDGVMGPITINAINSSSELRLIGLFRLNCANWYKKLIHKNPRLSEFETGWLKRAMS